MTDDMIEAVARAISNLHYGWIRDNWKAWEPEAEAAIRAAAPLILDMAADVVDDAEYAGFVRQLKERFQ
jgi:pyruvate/2-oxoglutarate dehydrogenase complex dihydrolipoamide acyltransferase (E2) component